MKKKIILMSLAAAMMLPMVAQAKEKNTSTFVEIQPIVGDCDALNVNFGVMYKANKNLSFGGGIGLMEPYKFNVAPTIPIFVRAQAETALEGVTPFVSFDAGFGANTGNFDASTIMINPMVGVKFGSVYAGIGYHGAIPTKGSGIANSVNFRLGYQFNNGIDNSAVKNFFSKTYFTAEIGGGIGLTSIRKDEYDPGQGFNEEKMTIGNNISAQISWMYKFNPNWSAGIGIGLNTYVCKYSDEEDPSNPYDGTDYVDWANSIPLYLRGQYTFKEDGEKVRPYIACDLGGLIRLSGDVNCSFNNLIFEPQVGVKFNDKYRVALGVATCNGDSYDSDYGKGFETKTVTSLNLKLGLDF